VGRTSSRGALGALYCVAPWCLQRGATSHAGEEGKPPGPWGLIETRCQYCGCGRKRAGVSRSVVPRGQGTASSFYRPRGGGLQSCRTALNATYGGKAHSVAELMVVLANLAPDRRCGESCTHRGVASRVAAWELPAWSPSVCWLEGSADGRPEDAQ
jgi:hypothetical protein